MKSLAFTLFIIFAMTNQIQSQECPDPVSRTCMGTTTLNFSISLCPAELTYEDGTNTGDPDNQLSVNCIPNGATTYIFNTDCDDTAPFTLTFIFSDIIAGTSSLVCSYNSSGNLPIVLPVELNSFNSRVNSSSIDLFWTTQSEISSSHFNIQRSNDGNNWETLTKIESAVYALESTDYFWTDRQPLSGENYYRLEMVDLDGSIDYSSIISGVFEDNNIVINAFPNPISNNTTTIEIDSEKFDNLRISLLDTVGKMVAEMSTVSEKGINLFSFQHGNLPSGIYYLKIVSQDWQKVLVLSKGLGNN